MDSVATSCRRRDSRPSPLVVWQLVDGKPGHESQSRGLIRALGDCREIETVQIRIRRRLGSLPNLLTRRFPEGHGQPDPDLIIAAGHATHLAALEARRARGGRLIVLMKPSLPLSWFDLCIVPAHDARPASGNVLLTRGVLNAVPRSPQRPAGRGLILIGGPSRHYDWSPGMLLRQIESLVQGDASRDWLATTSRRTPVAFGHELTQAGLTNLQVVPAERTSPEWLMTQLAAAEVVFVTEDSVSMVYESLTSGADVGLFRVPRRRAGRISRGIDNLIRDRLVIPFDTWQQDRFNHRTRQPLREADRCARFVCDQLLDAA